MKTVLLLVTFVLSNLAIAQNVGISADGATPHSSALLDVDASAVIGNKKGILIPRMTTTERDAIPVPANSLLVYNIDTECFDYYATNVWVSLCGVSVNSGSCPPGFVQINDQFSIEVNQRPLDSWFGAIQTCASVGGRLCNWVEWHTACISGVPLINMIDFWEWVDDGTGDNTVLTVGRLNCSASNSQATSLSTPFRCCCDH